MGGSKIKKTNLEEADAMNEFNQKLKVKSKQNADQNWNAKSFFPGDISIGAEYPAVDLENIFTLEEAKFQERLARIHVAAQLRSPQIQAFLNELENGEIFTDRHQKMHEKSRLCYEYSLDTLGYEKEAKDYSAFLDMMEYVAGIRSELDKETSDFLDLRLYYSDSFVNSTENLEREWAKDIDLQEIGKLDLKFENVDHIMTNIQMAVPKYKDVARNVLEGTKIKNEAAIPFMKEYFIGTGSRLLDPVFQDFEKTNEDGLERMDLVIVAGKTVREHMNEKHGADVVNGWTQEKRNQETALLLAAGLQNDNRVEIYVPQGNGVYNKPLPVTRDGCNVREMTKLEDGFWMSLLYAIGDFLHLTHHDAEKAEDEAVRSARSRVENMLLEKELAISVSERAESSIDIISVRTPDTDENQDELEEDMTSSM